MNRPVILIFGRVMNFLISALSTLSSVLISVRQKFKIARDRYEEYIHKIEKIINISQLWRLLKIKNFYLFLPLIYWEAHDAYDWQMPINFFFYFFNVHKFLFLLFQCTYLFFIEYWKNCKLENLQNFKIFLDRWQKNKDGKIWMKQKCWFLPKLWTF